MEVGRRGLGSLPCYPRRAESEGRGSTQCHCPLLDPLPLRRLRLLRPGMTVRHSPPPPPAPHSPGTPMPAQKGKDLLLKIDDGASGFVTVAGLRTRQLAFNAETVDVTNAESAGRWRELLAGAGVRRAGVTGSGVFKDETSDARLRQVFFDGDIRTYEIIVPDFGRLEGPFQITSLEYRGEHAGEVTFEMALESAGAVAFVAM